MQDNNLSLKNNSLYATWWIETEIYKLVNMALNNQGFCDDEYLLYSEIKDKLDTNFYNLNEQQLNYCNNNLKSAYDTICKFKQDQIVSIINQLEYKMDCSFGLARLIKLKTEIEKLNYLIKNNGFVFNKQLMYDKSAELKQKLDKKISAATEQVGGEMK